HLGPETLPLLALLGRNAGEGIIAADPREVDVVSPVLHLAPDGSPGLCLATLECLAPPGEVQAQPLQGLPAPACAFRVVQVGRILALGVAGQGRITGGVVAVTGGVVAVGPAHVVCQLGLRLESLLGEAGGGAVEAFDVT